MPIFFKVLLVIELLVLSCLQYDLWYGEGNVPVVQAAYQSVQEHRQQNMEKSRRNERIVEEIENIKLGENALEFKARMDLGMIMPGEVFYVLSSEPNDLLTND